jgi:rRNA maturation endonuclease Nob1
MPQIQKTEVVTWVMYCIRCQSSKQAIVSKNPPQGTCLICGAPLIVEREDSGKNRRYQDG